MCLVCFSSPVELLNEWMVKGVKFLSRLLNASFSDIVTVPLFFSLQTQTAPAPAPLSSFDIHATWRPVTQSIRSRRYHVKIGDCEQSIDVSEPLLKRDTFTLILESDHLHQPTYNLNIILWSSLTGGSTMYVCLFPTILKKNKKKRLRAG